MVIISGTKGDDYGFEIKTELSPLRGRDEEMEDSGEFDLEFGLSVGLLQRWMLVLRARLGVDVERPGGESVLSPSP
jgi:hypothetical protein